MFFTISQADAQFGHAAPGVPVAHPHTAQTPNTAPQCPHRTANNPGVKTSSPSMTTRSCGSAQRGQRVLNPITSSINAIL
jgi:hypothetical protein